MQHTWRETRWENDWGCRETEREKREREREGEKRERVGQSMKSFGITERCNRLECHQ